MQPSWKQSCFAYLSAIAEENINFKSLRPGGGIEPKYINNVQNRVAVKNLERGTLLTWDMLGAFS